MAPDCQDLGREMTSDHVTFDEANNPAFLNRVLALPALNDACNLAFTAYTTAKDKHQYVGVVLRTAEKGVLAAASTALPLATPIVERVVGWDNVDKWACRGLDRVEQAAPIITRPTNEIVTTTRHLLLGALAGESTAPPPTLTAAITSRATHTVDCVADTKGGRKAVDLAVCVADRLLDTGHSLIDTYSPAEEGDLHETDERDGGLANKGTALANRVSRRLVRSANHMLLNDANDYDVSDMDDVTTTIQRLVDLGRRSLLSWYSDVCKMSRGQLVKSGVTVTLNIGKTGLCTTQNLVAKSVGKTRAIVWGNVAAVHGLVMGNARIAVTRAVDSARTAQHLLVDGVNTTQGLVITGVSITQGIVKGSVCATHKIAKGGIHTTQSLVRGTIDVSQSVMKGGVNTAQNLVKGSIYTTRKMVTGSVQSTHYMVVGGKNTAQSMVMGGVRLTQSLMVNGVGITQTVIKKGLATGQGIANEGWELAHRGLQVGMGVALTTLTALKTVGTKSAKQMSAVVPTSIADTAHALYSNFQTTMTPIHQVLEYGYNAPSGMWSKVSELPESRIASRAQEWAAETLKAATAVIKQTAGGDVTETIPTSNPKPSQLPNPKGLVSPPELLSEAEETLRNVNKPAEQELSHSFDFTLNPLELLATSDCASADHLNPHTLCTDPLFSPTTSHRLPISPPMSPGDASTDMMHNQMAPGQGNHNCSTFRLDSYQSCRDAQCVLNCRPTEAVDLVISLTSPVRRVDLEAIYPIMKESSEGVGEYVPQSVSPDADDSISSASPTPTVKVSVMSSSCVGITTNLTTPVRYVDVEATCCCMSPGSDHDSCGEPYIEADIPGGIQPPGTQESEYVDVTLEWVNRFDREWQSLKKIVDRVTDSESCSEYIPSEKMKSCHATFSGPQTLLYPDPCVESEVNANGDECKDPLTDHLSVEAVAGMIPIEFRTNSSPASLKDTLHAEAKEDNLLGEVLENTDPEKTDLFTSLLELPPTMTNPFPAGALADTFPTVALTDTMPMVTLSDTPGSVSSGYASSEANYSPACWWTQPPPWEGTSDVAGAFGDSYSGQFMDPHERHHLINTRRALDERLGGLDWSAPWSPQEYPEVYEAPGVGAQGWPRKRKARRGRRSRWW